MHSVVVQSLIIYKCGLLLKYFCYGVNINKNNPSHRFSVVLACFVYCLNLLSFAGLVRNREKFTQLTEIFVCHGVMFSILDCEEFTAFTMCLAFVCFPSVNCVKPFVSIIHFPSIKAVKKNKSINQRKNFLFHSP